MGCIPTLWVTCSGSPCESSPCRAPTLAVELSEGYQHAGSTRSAPALAPAFHAPLYNVLGATFDGATADRPPCLAKALILDAFPVLVNIAFHLTDRLGPIPTPSWQLMQGNVHLHALS